MHACLGRRPSLPSLLPWDAGHDFDDGCAHLIAPSCIS